MIVCADDMWVSEFDSSDGLGAAAHARTHCLIYQIVCTPRCAKVWQPTKFGSLEGLHCTDMSVVVHLHVLKRPFHLVGDHKLTAQSL